MTEIKNDTILVSDELRELLDEDSIVESVEEVTERLNPTEASSLMPAKSKYSCYLESIINIHNSKETMKLDIRLVDFMVENSSSGEIQVINFKTNLSDWFKFLETRAFDPTNGFVLWMVDEEDKKTGFPFRNFNTKNLGTNYKLSNMNGDRVDVSIFKA